MRRSIDWLSKRLIKVGDRVSYHARRWYVHAASAYPLAHYYRAMPAGECEGKPLAKICEPRGSLKNPGKFIGFSRQGMLSDGHMGIRVLKGRFLGILPRQADPQNPFLAATAKSAA